MSFTDEDVKLAVKKGVGWLDLYHPNWVWGINVPLLEMRNCYNCILGQTLGNYFYALKGKRDEVWAIEHGFCAPYFFYPGGATDTMAEVAYNYRLEEVWSEEVRSRLS